jgi:putative CocE/NonD family hydrolase
MRRRYNVRVPMRDGVELATDVYLPPEGDRFPVVVGRTPYTKAHPLLRSFAESWTGHGYAMALQDVRGRGDSPGEFVPYLSDGRDGHDTIEWAAAQDWSSGRVALRGGSYSAHAAWLTALEQPPSLAAMIVVACPSDPFVESPTSGTSPMSISWHRLVDGRVLQDVEGFDWMEIYRHLPLEDLGEAAGFDAPLWREAIRHETLDEYWEPYRYQHRFAELDLPVLHISGWYDDEEIGTPINFTGMRTQGGGRARALQRMLIGPWGHRPNQTRTLGEVDFGPTALIDQEGYEAGWLDEILGRRPPDGSPPVRIFVMGSNVWRDEDDWPLPGTRFTDFFLRSGGNANSRHGDGRLDATPAAADEPPDVFVYDPARPVPFLTEPDSAQIGGPDDYSAIEQRGDVLCYTTEPLAEDTEVTGPVRLVLHASSSAVDTDFTAKLVDVHPSGFCQRLCDGVVRARYREGHDRTVLMDPGTVYELDIALWDTCQVFKAGHRIRLEVSSSAFPKYDRNLNTGESIASGTRMVTAENRVWHDAGHPSRLVLPIVPAHRGGG